MTTVAMTAQNSEQESLNPIPPDVVFEEDELDEVYLAAEEEKKLAESYSEYYSLPFVFADFCLSDDDSNTSDPSPRHANPHGNCDADGRDNEDREDSEVPQHSVERVRYRLRTPPTKASLKQFIQKYDTCKWNNHPDEVYSLLNVSACIVKPQHLLSISSVSNIMALSMSNILSQLEACPRWQTTVPPWSAVPKFIDEFLSVFDRDFKDLPNNLSDKKLAKSELARLTNVMTAVDVISKRPEKPWYGCFITLLEDMLECLPEDIPESLFTRYVLLLIEMYKSVTKLPISIDAGNRKYDFRLPGDGKMDFKLQIVPDMSLSFKKKTILVGEVKKFGGYGKDDETEDYERHRGSIPINTPENTLAPVSTCQRSDKPQLRRKEQPPEYSSGLAGKVDMKNSKQSCPHRPLNYEERFKVNCFLPQLLGQMLGALQRNRMPSRIGTEDENVQLGFCVEGFKLRFVKLVLRDYKCTIAGRPSVEQLLKSLQIKSEVFVTQELNLMKKNHLRMFYQMLLAMTFACELYD